MASSSLGPEVQTCCGPVRGLREKSGVVAFKGIPYAAPPIGALRWRRPQPHAPWGPGCRECIQFGASSLQPQSIFGDIPDNVSEDCLYLNVYTPGGVNFETAKLPVFVWIHGGAFRNGSGDRYPVSNVAAQGLVAVNFNYRLGALGWLRPEGNADYNCGLWDMVEALKWVNRNISNFGGDPSNVTICGQSAGGTSVICLCASPVANKLFRRAIPMSCMPHQCLDSKLMSRLAKDLAYMVTGSSAATADDMRTASAQVFNETRKVDPSREFTYHSSGLGWYQVAFSLSDLGPLRKAAGYCEFRVSGLQEHALAHFPYVPVVGADELIPEWPYDLLAKGSAAHIDLLVGGTREENGFSASPSHPERTAPLTYGGKVNNVEQAIARCAREFMGLGRIDPVASAERLVHSYVSAEREGGFAPAGSVQHAWDRLASDLAFNAPAVMVAARQHQHNPGNLYVFRYEGNNKRRSFHGWELDLVLGNVPEKSKPPFHKLSDTMLQAWTSFARTGNPNGPAALPKWAAWGSSGLDGVVMCFDTVGISPVSYTKAAPAIRDCVDLIDAAFVHSSQTEQRSRL